MDKQSILIFGVGPLQKSLIIQCKLKGLFTVGIDPMEDASCKNDVDAFEVVDGQNFEKTIEIAKRYNVSGIITAATDKPLIMMARVADRLNLPFFSVETADWSTDKLLMKQKFMEAEIPCAKGFLLNNVCELESIKIDYPVIVKPRDNSGSRGVIYCKNLQEVEQAVQEALQFTKKGSVLLEEFIEGKEYSVEGIHYKGDSHIIQITEKITTAFPYNVELGHIQPADIPADQKKEILLLVSNTAKALGFTNCASHTEIKINQQGIFVIETSPRLGGDYITSHLVPLSSGINIEELLISVSLGLPLVYKQKSNASLVSYLNFPIDTIVNKLISEEELKRIFPDVKYFSTTLRIDDTIKKITNSLNRYGQFILVGDNIKTLLHQKEEIDRFLQKIMFNF